MNQDKHLKCSINYIFGILSGFEAIFCINELLFCTDDFSLSKKRKSTFFTKQESIKSEIQSAMKHCFSFIDAKIERELQISQTRMRILREIAKKFPNQEVIINEKIRQQKAKHSELKTALALKRNDIFLLIEKSFTSLQKRYDNQTERIKLTFGLT